MLIAKVEGGNVLEVGTPQSLFPNTSFTEQGPDAEFLAEHSCMTINDNVSYDPQTEKLVPCEPIVLEGEIVRLQAVELTQQELDDMITQRWNEIRTIRTSHLRSCDWTQVPDTPLTAEKKQEWVVYRQALRDITDQPIDNIVWPTPPTASTV